VTTPSINCQLCVTETVAWVEEICEFVFAGISSCPGDCGLDTADIDADHAPDCTFVKDLREFFIGSIYAKVLPATFVTTVNGAQLFVCQDHWLKHELEL
jgi:hypothetical protein